MSLPNTYQETTFDELVELATTLDVPIPQVRNRKVLYDRIVKALAGKTRTVTSSTSTSTASAATTTSNRTTTVTTPLMYSSHTPSSSSPSLPRRVATVAYNNSGNLLDYQPLSQHRPLIRPALTTTTVTKSSAAVGGHHSSQPQLGHQDRRGKRYYKMGNGKYVESGTDVDLDWLTDNLAQVCTLIDYKPSSVDYRVVLADYKIHWVNTIEKIK